MSKAASTFWKAALAALLLTNGAVAREHPVHVELHSASGEYVLGEPVVLRLAVKNLGDEDIRTWVDLLVYQIKVYIASEGKDFSLYKQGEHVIYEVHPSTMPLEPRQSKAYVLRVLCTFYFTDTLERRSELAFPEPGTYLVRARYPLYNTAQEIESNTIAIRIKPRRGVDAKLWQQIGDKEFWHFVQRGYPPHLNKDIPLRAAELVNSVPHSSYHDGLRWALAEFYLRYAGMPETRLSEEEKRLIERALSPEDLRRIRERRGERAAPETR